MKVGPDIAGMAALMGDPARANMLTALMGGGALTATELAAEAGVTKQTASAHLAKLLEADFLGVERQGRHRYYRLADGEVARVLEGLMGLAARRGPVRVRTGPKEPALRKARVCYDHLAGDLGVGLFDSARRNGWIAVGGEGGEGETVSLTEAGRALVLELGVDPAGLARGRRPLCRACLDWSVRRSHLAGALGGALLSRVYDLGWARRVEGTRVVAFTRAGEAAFRERFRLAG